MPARTDIFAFCRIRPEFVPLSGMEHVSLDLRYAGTANVLGQDLYQGEREAWLHREAAQALAEAAQALQAEKPGWRILLYDAARPLRVQARLFAHVQGTPQQAYVADPAQGSAHNYGMAVDCGLRDDQGREADLGTAFDSFEDLAQPQLEEAFLRQGRLRADQVGLRRLLRRLMQEHGFLPNSLEWWHFDRLPVARLQGRYPLIDLIDGSGA